VSERPDWGDMEQGRAERQDAIASLGSAIERASGGALVTTFCPHGVSHQPGYAHLDGRSGWCGECFPPERYESMFTARERANATREADEGLWWYECDLGTICGVVAAPDEESAVATAYDEAAEEARGAVESASVTVRRLEP